MTQENIQTLLIAIARVEVLEDRLCKKRGCESDFLVQLLAAKEALKAVKAEA